GGVLVEEVPEHAVPVLCSEVAGVEGNAEQATDRHRVTAILLGATAGAAVVLLPVAHEHAGHVHAGALQQQRGHGGVDPAGDAHHHALGRRRGHHGTTSTAP